MLIWLKFQMNMIYFIYQIISFYIISFYLKKYLNIKDKIIENPSETEIYQDKSVVIACEKRASWVFFGVNLFVIHITITH